MENVNGFKVAVTAIAAGVSAVLGWFGWLVVAFVACLTWISCGFNNGEWSSKKGREGVWHKAGCIVVVLVAAVKVNKSV